MKLHVFALALSIGCSSPAKPAPQEPVKDPTSTTTPTTTTTTPTPTPTATTTTTTTTPPAHDLPITPTIPDPAPAQDPPLTGQAKLAAEENEAGKQLLFDRKYAEASVKFRDAAARSPQATYYFNLCTSLYQEGKFGEALSACNAIASHNPKPELAAKADKLTAKIKDDAKRQGIEVRSP